MRPQVSVVIPAYNAEKWIRETITSVFNQTYPDIELIVVDDCSTDGTWDTLQEIKQSAPRNITSVVLSRNEKNLKECRTSRKGFSLASGKFICRLSADDQFVSKYHLENQVAVLEKSGADWCYNSDNIAGESISAASLVRSLWFPIPRRICPDALQILDNNILSHPYIAFLILLIRNPVNSSTFMIRAESYRGQAQWSDRHWTDCDSILLMNLLLHRSHGTAIAEIGAFYRIHSGQGSLNPDYTQEVIRIRKEIVSSVQKGRYPHWFKWVSLLIVQMGIGHRHF
jgi:glycosyltransferase involved in cell wall biosynthesis